MDFIPNTSKDKEQILKKIGARSFEELIKNIPQEARLRPKQGLLKQGLSEMEVLAHLKALSNKNNSLENYVSFLGAGSYFHFVPSVISALISRGEFLTAYTPYQPEASQGTLQATFEFQTMIAELYGMDVANASLYDGASAIAEAAFMALRETGRAKILVSRAVHPESRQTLRTHCHNFEIKEIGALNGKTSAEELKQHLDETTACVIVQTPNFFGCLEDGTKIAELARAKGALLIVSSNPIALGLISPPGEMGADIAVGEGQPLGLSLNYGGPYLGLFCCKASLVRKMPGRVVGVTKDLDGKRGYVLTLQTREQHIRREKATSNICTNEALMALAATVYLSILGPQGLKELAELNFQKAHYAAAKISSIPGFRLRFSTPFFNEFVLESALDAEEIHAWLLQRGIFGGLPLSKFYPELPNSTLYCATEMNSKEQIDLLAESLREISAAKQQKSKSLSGVEQ